MGKALSFVMALCDLGLLALLVAARHLSMLQDAGLFATFVVLAMGAWMVAVVSAVVHALRYGSGWRWLLALVVLLWLPTLPALCYGLSGAPALARSLTGGRRVERKRASAGTAQAMRSPTVAHA